MSEVYRLFPEMGEFSEAGRAANLNYFEKKWILVLTMVGGRYIYTLIQRSNSGRVSRFLIHGPIPSE